MKHAKILVVDDNREIRELIDRHLTALGFLVVQASDAFEALHKLSRISIDVVLTDYEMPGLNGLQLFSRAKETLAGREVSFVLMTGNSSFKRAEVRALGFAEFLEKPFSFEALLPIIERAVGTPGRAREIDSR